MAIQPVSSSNSNAANWNQINTMVRQLNNEQTTKVFKQAGGNSVIIGKLPYDNGRGLLIYDSDNDARILIGIDPDGEPNAYITKTGYDVLDELA